MVDASGFPEKVFLGEQDVVSRGGKQPSTSQ